MKRLGALLQYLTPDVGARAYVYRADTAGFYRCSSSQNEALEDMIWHTSQERRRVIISIRTLPNPAILVYEDSSAASGLR